MNISYYNSTKEYKNQKEELSSLLNRIRVGEWKDEVSTLRYHLKNDEKKEFIVGVNEDLFFYSTNKPSHKQSATKQMLSMTSGEFDKNWLSSKLI